MFLAFIIKYKEAGSTEYIFRFNENIPAYLLISIIVALFMGLTVSAEEIIRDRKILKRESFLNLSWSSYLSSKLIILFMMSAIQTLTFVLIGNLILEIKEMTMSFWLVLFSVSCFANILGLNISASFNSAVTVYIIIPLLLIPQMILSGLLFNFDKLNSFISSKGEVPIVADMMASRWAYEAMAVYQFKENSYQRPYFELERRERQADFKAAYLIPELESKLQSITNNLALEGDSAKAMLDRDLYIFRKEIEKESFRDGIEDIDISIALSPANVTSEVIQQFRSYLKSLNKHYMQIFNDAVDKKEKLAFYLEKESGLDYDLNQYKNVYYNESISDLVRNVNTADRIVEYKGRLLQRVDPVFNQPTITNAGFLNYRTHFFAPKKQLAGRLIDTFYFNIMIIWTMTILLYFSLYNELFRKIISLFGRIKLPSYGK